MDTEGSDRSGCVSDVASGHGSHRRMAGVDTRENRRNPSNGSTRQVAVRIKKKNFLVMVT